MLGEGLEGPAYHACAPNPCCMGTCSGWPEGYSMTSFSCRGLAPSSGWTASVFGRRAWSVLRGLETLYKVSSLANMMVFLRNGVYRCALIYSVCGGLFLPPSIGHRGGLICVWGRTRLWSRQSCGTRTVHSHLAVCFTFQRPALMKSCWSVPPMHSGACLSACPVPAWCTSRPS